MGEEALPPKVRQRVALYQQTQQRLQAILLRKQQLNLELMEIENALRELEKVGEDTPVYKSVGSLLIRTEKGKVVKELEDRREYIKLRLESLDAEERRAREQLKELQAKLRKDLRGLEG